MSKLIIPEEIKQALDLVRDETADVTERQVAGIKFGIWMLGESATTRELLMEEKKIVKDATEKAGADTMAIAMASVARVSERMAVQHEIDILYEEVSSIMHRLSGEESTENPETRQLTVCNGHVTDITRVSKSNKNDGDKSEMPA